MNERQTRELEDFESARMERTRQVRLAWHVSAHGIVRAMKAFVTDCPPPSDLDLLSSKSWKRLDEVKQAWVEFGKVIDELKRARDAVDERKHLMIDTESYVE